MISALTAQVIHQLQEVDALERAQSDAEYLQETLRSLEDVRQPIADLAASYGVLRVRMPHDRVSSLDLRIATLAQQLRESQEAFPEAPRQVRFLSTIKSQTQQISTELALEWRSLADIRRRPLIQLLDIVERLPELRDRRTTLAQLRSALDRAANTVPHQEQHLDLFDQLCQRLEEQLVDVRGLSGPIRAFLEKVVKGTATLADLSGDVLAWCQTDTRATAFQVVFATSEAE